MLNLKLTTKTNAVREQHKFDTEKLDACLQDSVTEYEGPVEVRQFSGGHSSPTYLLKTAKQNLVLRKKPPGVLIKSAHAVDREFRVLSALHAAGYPVPRPIFFCDDETIIGTIFYVMEFVPGRVFLNPKLPGLSPSDRADIYDSSNAALAKLHLLDFKKLGLAGFGKPGNYFARQIERWTKQYISAHAQTNAEMNRLIDWLPRAIPVDDSACVVHGDFSFHNFFFSMDHAGIVAVGDWELSTIGNPLADVTYHAMEWYRPDTPARPTLSSMTECELTAAGIPTLDAYIRSYCRRTGRAGIGNLEFYQAYNLFRLACITQGVVSRAVAGTAVDPNAAQLAERIPVLAKEAWLKAEQAGAMP